MLFFIQRRRFTGGAHGDNRLSTLFDMPFDQIRQRLIIEAAIVQHRRYQGHHTAMKHEILHRSKTDMVLAGTV